MTGFSLGEFPARYLGILFFPKKWLKVDCHIAVEKLFEKLNVG